MSVPRLYTGLDDGGFGEPCPWCGRDKSGLHSTRQASSLEAPDRLTENDSIGLSIDMLDVDRLREWARLLLVHGPNIGEWGSVPYVAGKMQMIATGIEKAIRDIGQLRSSRRAAPPSEEKGPEDQG